MRQSFTLKTRLLRAVVLVVLLTSAAWTAAKAATIECTTVAVEGGIAATFKESGVVSGNIEATGPITFLNSEGTPIGDTGITYAYYTNADQNKDICFVKETYSKFLINQNPSRYIASVEIEWGTPSAYSGSGLHILGRGDGRDEYRYSKTDTTSLVVDYDAQVTLSPARADAQNKSFYSFADNGEKIRCLAMVISLAKKGGEECFTRVKSMTITFVDELPDNTPSTVKATLGSGKEVENIEWSNRGMQLSDVLTVKDGPAELSLSDLRFTIRPDFAISAKPAPGAAAPAGIYAEAWNLYLALEEGGHSYDGYLESPDAMECAATGSLLRHTLSIPAPCSGRYILSVESRNPDVPIEANDLVLNIWPGIRNAYGHLASGAEDEDLSLYNFNINYVVFNDESESMAYPYAEEGGEPYAKDMGLIHIPGLYNAEIFYKWDDASMHAVRGASESGDGGLDLAGYVSHSETPLNLSNLTSAGANLSLRICKNNAVTPVDANGNSEVFFNIFLSNSQSIPTAVGSYILSRQDADAPVEIYTLSGMRVNTPSPAPGLYIISGKKVIVR